MSKNNNEIERQEIHLDEDHILFGVMKEGEKGLNLIFNMEIDGDGEHARFLQEQTGRMLGLVAAGNDHLQRIIGEAFRQSIKERSRREGKTIPEILSGLLYEDGNPKAVFPVKPGPKS